VNLKDQVFLITGASMGIGASCARLFREKGARLSLTALAGDGFADHATDTELVTTGDLTDASFRRRLVETTLQHFGKIDVFINNAGVGQYGYPSEVDVEISKRLFDINVFSPVALAQLIIPQMRSRGTGAIVNIGSVGGAVSLPWAVMYCATKWSIHCVDDSMRRELIGTGIHVMKVCPGIVATGFRDHVLAGKAPGRVEDLKRVVTPDQVAAGIAKGLASKKRRVYVPSLGRIFTSMEFFAPWLMDRYLQTKY
jgi:short-subunit dehydrogenase